MQNKGAVVKEHAKVFHRATRRHESRCRVRRPRGTEERAGPAGARGAGGELLAVLHTIGQSAGAHGGRSGFTGTGA